MDIYGLGVTEFGVAQAERYYDVLAEHPRIARERFEFRPPVRLHPYRAHMIVYIAEANGILIVRVLHGRQDWERHLS